MNNTLSKQVGQEAMSTETRHKRIVAEFHELNPGVAGLLVQHFRREGFDFVPRLSLELDFYSMDKEDYDKVLKFLIEGEFGAEMTPW
jgi:hypothetical protein